MKSILAFLFIFTVTSLSQSQSFGKRITRYGFEIDVKPFIYYDTYFTYSPNGWKPVLNLILKIQNDLLQFTKIEGNYQAKYELNLALLNTTKDSPIITDIWNRSVQEEQFEKTNSTTIYQVENKKFELNIEPGSYKLVLDVIDIGSGKMYKSTRELIFPDTSNQPIKHTEIRLLSTRDSLSAEIPVKEAPTVVEFDQDLIASWGIECPVGDSIKIKSSLKHLHWDKEILVQENEFSAVVDKKNFHFNEFLSRNLFQEGKHTLTYSINTTSKSIEIVKEFNIVWYKKPLYLQETELAIRPLKYLLESEEWEKVDDMSHQEQEEWFQNYWKQKDPTEGTPFNEIQYEFYFRVDLANNEFSLRFKEGWETDRGYAMIVFGEPDQRDKHHYVTYTKPYEIWYYDMLNKKATFVDVEGNDDYKLVAIEDLKNE